MEQVKERAKPYFIDNNAKTLAILVHGFTGTPDNLRELAHFLADKGITVKAPLLAGHGRTWQDLEKCTCYDWWQSLHEEIKWAGERFENVFLIGNSFGANLCLDMAARYPETVKGVIALGVSIFFRNDFFGKHVVLPLHHFFFKKYRIGFIKKEHWDEYERNGSYITVPTKALKEFFKFIKYYTKRELGKVKVPALIIHSHDDEVIHPLSSQYVYDRLGSVDKELLYLDDINHNPLESRMKNFIFKKIDEFINRLK